MAKAAAALSTPRHSRAVRVVLEPSGTRHTDRAQAGAAQQAQAQRAARGGSMGVAVGDVGLRQVRRGSAGLTTQPPPVAPLSVC